MSFIKTPIKGMRDQLPTDMKLRQSVMNMIRETYALYGFSEIETPAVEHIENLSNKQGGENEKLIFKIQKRGREFDKAMDKGLDLCDSGLRYDLTVPLARYYANNANELPSPFKALQIGNVWRADNPQKGRFRQFTQCDIDILGENTIMAEIELIAATANMLTRIFEQVGIKSFTVHVSDRHILRALAAYAGFAEDQYGDIFIILDKMDKIGLDGVENELIEKGYDADGVKKYIDVFRNGVDGVTAAKFCESISDHIDGTFVNGLDTIISCVRTMVSEDINIVFDPTLVRGMGYYTGTIFECTIDGYNFSIAGGGRYDKMIGQFSGTEVSACGFSIGFERIITILSDHLKDADVYEAKYAILVENKVSTEKMLEVFDKASKLRAEGKTVTVQTLKKNAKFQINKLMETGFTEIEKVYKD